MKRPVIAAGYLNLFQKLWNNYVSPYVKCDILEKRPLGKGKFVDMIQKLGPLAFASRLKRISERLMRDVSRIYRELDVEFHARWFPVMYLLGQKSPLAVTEVARELGLTHPAINQIAAGMTKAGLLLSTKDSQDERRRMLSISPEGGKVLASLAPVWRDIEAATAEVIEEAGKNLLVTLDKVEQALDEKDMYRRVSDRIKERQFNKVEIIEYEPRFRKDFERLNVEWLKKYFTVEDYDRALLGDPRRRILNKGGFILFARSESEIVGTIAVMKHEDGTIELAKTCVTRKFQGRQIGKRLVMAALERVEKGGAESIILFTSPILTAANNLYHKLGFEEVEAPQPSKFQRHSITMELKLNPKHTKT